MIPARYRSGKILYGDDFDPDQIEAWFRDEETAYGLLPVAQGPYAFRAFNEFHAYRFLRRQRYGACLAIGCYDGRDIEPIANHIDHIFALEPDASVVPQTIGETPTIHIKPATSGTIGLEDDSVDLVTSFGVLHHIPNVSHVLSELVRVLRPGGLIVIRETSSSMGDWSTPRPGLTPHERGISPAFLKDRLAGLKLLRFRQVMWRPTYKLKGLIRCPFNSMPIVIADWLASEAFRWNNRYWRDRKLDFFGPSSVLVIAQKV